MNEMQRHAEAEVARLATFADGRVGVAAEHIESGRQLFLDQQGLFPLASTIKIALAMCVLDCVDRSLLALTDMIEVQEAEMTPLGVIGAEFPHPGIALSLLNIIELTMVHSDNTATDVAFRLAGGPEEVQRYVRAIGIRDLEVRRTMREALCVLHGIDLPPSDISIREVLAKAPPEVLDARDRPFDDFVFEQRDKTTPAAMLDLLLHLWRADGVSAASRDVLLDIMSRTRTSPGRIPNRLPPGVKIVRKTGTGRGTSNDAGFLTLPNGRGTVAIAVYVTGSRHPLARRDAVIADVARFILDYFTVV
jgi:beta-lactamase class A